MVRYLLQKIPADQKRLTLSTALTLMRIGLVPLVVVAMIMHWWGIAFGVFVAAAITDMLDGFLARYLHQQTFLGACLDPLADKLLIVSVFATLACISTPFFTIPYWFVFIVLAKELVQISGGAFLYWLRDELAMQPTWLGKMTMVLQTCFIVWLFACYFFQWMPIKTYYGMLGSLLVCIGATFVQYVRHGYEQLVD